MRGKSQPIMTVIIGVEPGEGEKLKWTIEPWDFQQINNDEDTFFSFSKQISYAFREVIHHLTDREADDLKALIRKEIFDE